MKYWTRIFWLQTYPSLFLRIVCLSIESRGPAVIFFIPTALCVTFCNYLLPAFVQLDICQKKKRSLLKWIITWYFRSIASVTKETISVIWESEVSYKTEVEHLSAPECGKCEAVEKMRKNMYWVPSMTQENSSEGKFGKSKVGQEKLKLWILTCSLAWKCVSCSVVSDSLWPHGL